MKKVIYSVIVGGYDDLSEAPLFDGWDCILFTDQRPKSSKGWKVIMIDDLGERKKVSRKYKINVHQFLPEYDLYCYIDGNGTMLSPPPERPVFYKHYSRQNIVSECQAIIKLKKEDPQLIKDQLNHYKSEGFPDDRGLIAFGFFVRPNKDVYNDLFESWYKQIERWSYRDQISFPYVLWQKDMTLKGTDYNLLRKYVRFKSHRAKSSKFEVHYITPGRPDLLYGRAVNQLIEPLPENDWVCLRDIDTLVLDHKVLFQQVKDIIVRHGDRIDMFGAMTNDVGLSWQLYEGRINRSYDVEYHYKVNQKLIKDKYDEITDDNKYIAGFFMLFSKKIWRKIGGFPEPLSVNGNFFDYLVSKAVDDVGGKIGICQGVYIYHFKRYGKNPRDISHLINENSR